MGRAGDLRDAARYRGLLRPGLAFGYLGWAGEGNVGDDLMYVAHRRALAPLTVARLPARRTGPRLAVLARVPAGVRARTMLLGGGTLFGRGDWLERLETVRAATGPRPWMTLGVGVEEPGFGFADGATLARWARTARSWPVLGVRGPRSRELLADHGLEATLTGDPALLLADAAPPATVRERLLGVSLAVPEARHGDPDRVAATVESALATLRKRGWRLRVFVFSRHDAARAAVLAGELVSPRTVPDLLRTLGECEVLVGERLHAMVMAAAAGTPALALEYRPKLRDFMASLDREALAVRADRTTAAQLVDAVEDLAARRAEESAHLRAAVAAAGARLRAAAAAISDNARA